MIIFNIASFWVRFLARFRRRVHRRFWPQNNCISIQRIVWQFKLCQNLAQLVMTKTGRLLGRSCCRRCYPDTIPGSGDKAGDCAACSILFIIAFVYTLYFDYFERFVSVSKSKLYYELIKFCQNSLLIIFNLKYCTNGVLMRFCGSNITDYI